MKNKKLAMFIIASTISTGSLLYSSSSLVAFADDNVNVTKIESNKPIDSKVLDSKNQNQEENATTYNSKVSDKESKINEKENKKDNSTSVNNKVENKNNSKKDISSNTTKEIKDSKESSNKTTKDVVKDSKSSEPKKVDSTEKNSTNTISSAVKPKFHSEIQEKLYYYMMNPENQKSVDIKAVELHNGVTSNNCVYFASEALRRVGVKIPTKTAYTTKLEAALKNVGWKKVSDLSQLQPGDICFAGEMHAYIFMGWANEEHTLAYVVDNQKERFDGHIYHERGLYDGKGITPTSHFYEYVDGSTEENVNKPYKKIAEGTVKVNSTLNVRSNPSTKSDIIGTLKNDTKVDITGSSNNFYRINYDGDVGYIYSDYVKNYIPVKNEDNKSEAKPDTDKKTATKPETKPNTDKKTDAKPEVKPEKKLVGTIKVHSYLNVRSGASTHSRVIGSLKNNYKVTITDEKGDFYQIDYKGGHAYVSKDYVKVSSNHNNTKKASSSHKPKESNKSTDNRKDTKTGVINVNTYLNVRSGASTHSHVIGSLRRNERVTILESKGDFYKIDYKGGHAYVSKDYVKVDGDSSNSSSHKSVSSKKARINAHSGLNLRRSNNTDAGYILTIPHNKVVTVLDNSHGWYKVNYNGHIGWVYGKYISK